MDGDRRRQLAEQALEGYTSGQDAPIEAAAVALVRAASATSLVLVEGISDQMAVEELANRQGRDLEVEGVAVIPIGGANAATRYLTDLGQHGTGLGQHGTSRTIVGLCDAAEEQYFRQALSAAGFGSPQDRDALEQLGFFVCVDDLEDELIRACGQQTTEAVLESQGDLGSFRTLQKQQAWRHREFQDQMRRFLGAGARRKLRYARLLTRSVDLNRVPAPLEAVLARV